MKRMESTVVVLFADVSGSAKLYERLGAAEAGRAVDRCIKRMERSVEGFQGSLLKTEGNEMVATFQSADDAYHAAREMQQRVAALPPVTGVQLAIRIGLHIGQVPEKLSGELGDTAKTAARIIGLAKPGQILASSEALAGLPDHLRGAVRDSSTLEQISGLSLLEVSWADDEAGSEAAKPETPAPSASSPAPLSTEGSDAVEDSNDDCDETRPVKLCIRYRGKAYLLDNKTPIMSLGRDSSSDLVIEDQKASRQHGRIERRGMQYYYVDRSSNGTYVAFGRAPETLVRHGEVLLVGRGSIGFGTSCSDPITESATFEYM